jgi:hypothetical protein
VNASQPLWIALKLFFNNEMPASWLFSG